MTLIANTTFLHSCLQQNSTMTLPRFSVPTWKKLPKKWPMRRKKLVAERSFWHKVTSQWLSPVTMIRTLSNTRCRLWKWSTPMVPVMHSLAASCRNSFKSNRSTLAWNALFTALPSVYKSLVASFLKTINSFLNSFRTILCTGREPKPNPHNKKKINSKLFTSCFVRSYSYHGM